MQYTLDSSRNFVHIIKRPDVIPNYNMMTKYLDYMKVLIPVRSSFSLHWCTSDVWSVSPSSEQNEEGYFALMKSNAQSLLGCCLHLRMPLTELLEISTKNT